MNNIWLSVLLGNLLRGLPGNYTVKEIMFSSLFFKFFLPNFHFLHHPKKQQVQALIGIVPYVDRSFLHDVCGDFMNGLMY